MSCRLRLFKRLQQSIRRLLVHVIRIFDYEDAGRTLEGSKVRFAFKFTNWADANDLLVRPRHCDISVFAPNHARLVLVVVIEWRKSRAVDSLAG